MSLASVAVRMAARKKAVDTVYIVGCDLKNRSQDICKKIEKSLQQDNLQTQVLNNILYNAQTMEKLEDAKCAVLVETVGSTLYNEIAKK